ncbi:MAG: MbtH family NRPS accessory protein [Methylocapsa sp.]|nr:MbtH family NRPS accessory protein [Methylocapsa sp.]
MVSEEADGEVYTVIANHEEQYSIWPVWKAIPAGWQSAGKMGLKEECLAYVNEVWTDMRPLSLRSEMGNESAISRGTRAAI